MNDERTLFDSWFKKRFYKKAYYREKLFQKWLVFKEKYKFDFDHFYDEQGQEFFEMMVTAKKRKRINKK